MSSWSTSTASSQLEGIRWTSQGSRKSGQSLHRTRGPVEYNTPEDGLPAHNGALFIEWSVKINGSPSEGNLKLVDDERPGLGPTFDGIEVCKKLGSLTTGSWTVVS